MLNHETSTHEESEPEQEVTINHPHPNATQPVHTNMYMSYIEGMKMDWTVNDALYNRFLKWKLNCKNILECELAALPECQKCRKVITWSGDFGMDQYVSWGYPKMKWILTQFGRGLKMSVNCNPMRCKPDLTFWPVFTKEIRALMNDTMLYRCKLISQNILLKLWKYYIETSFGSSYMMKILCLDPLQKEVLICTSFLPVEFAS